MTDSELLDLYISKNSIDSEGDKLVLFGGRIVRKNGALAFSGPFAQFFLPITMGKAVWLQKIGEEEEVCIGVSASDFRISDGVPNDEVNVIGSIEKKLRDGVSEYICVQLGKHNVIVKTGDRFDFNDGDFIGLKFSRCAATLFRCSFDHKWNSCIAVSTGRKIAVG